MKLNGIQFISVSQQQPLIKKEPALKQEFKPANFEVITASLWGTLNKANSPFIPYFAGTEINSAIPSFKVCNLDKLTCPGCGRPMFPRPLFEELQLRLQKAPEKEYLNILSEYESYMKEVENNVFNEVKEVSEYYPEKTLQQIISKLTNEKLPQLESIQFRRLKSMKSIAETMPKREKGSVFDLLNGAEDKIKRRGIKHPFRRKEFIEEVQSLKINDYKTKQKLIDIAENFPSSKEAECAWIVKYSGRDNNGKQRSSQEIAERFLLTAVANTDHMLAQDPKMGGKDIIPNYIAMHSGCNSEKTNKTFMEWFNEDPEMRTIYIQIYLNEVQKAIDNGEIDDPRYQNYPEEAAATIKQLSGGTLDFQIEKDLKTIA